jgi:glycosyltransferase involved in cell wall biosynthesis
MKKPLVSVIISTFNVEKYVVQAVGSILSQSYSNIEIFVIDDCSTDKTLKLLRGFGNRIKLFVSDSNHGVSINLNKILNVARGEYVVFFDADDIMGKTMISELVGAMEGSVAAFAYCNLHVFFDGEAELLKFHFEYPEEADFSRFVLGNFLKLSQVMIRKDILERHKIKFDTSFRYSGDWDLWLQITSLNLKGVLLNRELLVVCQRPTGMSGSLRGKYEAKLESLMVWNKWLPFIPKKEHVPLEKIIENVKIRAVINGAGLGAVSDLSVHNFGSLWGKSVFFAVRVLQKLIPAQFFYRLESYYYKTKERHLLFTNR